MILCDWRFEWITTWDDVWSPNFSDRWQGLLKIANNSHVFATLPLVRAWWLAAQNVYKVDPCFLLATSTDGATVFMPLVIVSHGIKNACLRMLQPAGNSVYDYHDPISHGFTQKDWPSFWETLETELLTRWHGKFDRAAISGLRLQPEVVGVGVVDSAPYLNIGSCSSPEEFLASLGKSLRGDIRRQLRRLEEVGPVSCRVLQSTETETALAWLPEILEQHLEKWPNSYKLPGFHAALIREALPSGLLHLSELKVGDAVVSRHLGFFYQRRFYWYMPVYNHKYQIYSPGKLHLYFCAVEAIDKNGDVFDLLRGKEEYKLQWTEQADELYAVGWRSSAIGSALKLALVESVKPLLQKLLRGMQ